MLRFLHLSESVEQWDGGWAPAWCLEDLPTDPSQFRLSVILKRVQTVEHCQVHERENTLSGLEAGQWKAGEACSRWSGQHRRLSELHWETLTVFILTACRGRWDSLSRTKLTWTDCSSTLSESVLYFKNLDHQFGGQVFLSSSSLQTQATPTISDIMYMGWMG